METCTDIQLPEMISALAHSSTGQYDIQQIPEKYIKDEHALIMAKCTSITSILLLVVELSIQHLITSSGSAISSYISHYGLKFIS